jgi:hypothetical protein
VPVCRRQERTGSSSTLDTDGSNLATTQFRRVCRLRVAVSGALTRIGAALPLVTIEKTSS